MTLAEYLKLASRGATITALTLPDGGPLVAYAWPQIAATQRGWEMVLADYHGNILGQLWTAGGERERNAEAHRLIVAGIKRTTKAVA